LKIGKATKAKMSEILEEMSDDERSTNYDEGDDGSRKKKPNSVTASSVSISVNDDNSKFDHTPHDLFIQLNELHGAGDFREWCETARWIKYEENVEEGADRWGRPHVSSLCFHSLLNVRRSLDTGIVMLDLEAKDFTHIVYQTVETVRIHQFQALWLMFDLLDVQ
jgi:Band 3 cytoplasmic domain